MIGTLSYFWPFGFRTNNITHRFQTHRTQHTCFCEGGRDIEKFVKIFQDFIAKTISKFSRTKQCEFCSITHIAHHYEAVVFGPSWKRITLFFHCIFSCKCLPRLNQRCVSPDEARAQRPFLMGANCNGEISDAGYRSRGSSKSSAVVQVSVSFRSWLFECQQQ